MTLRDTEWRKHPRAGAYTALIEEAAKKHGVDPEVLGAQIHRESHFDPNAVSEAGAQGIAQIVPRFHPGVDPYNPAEAIDYGASYLAKLEDQFDSTELALAAYNTGPDNLRKALRHGDQWLDHTAPETQSYVNALSPERVTYTAPASAQEDPLLSLAKQVDQQNSGIQQEAEEVLAMMASEPDIEENLRTRGWFVDTLAGLARGPIKAAAASLGVLSNPGAMIAPEVFAPKGPNGEEFRAPVDRALDAPLNAIGETETIPGALAEGLSQWTAGFLVTRRITGALPSMVGTGTASRVMKSMKATLDSALASFAFFKGKEGSLATLIESSKEEGGFPDISNPITAWMADKTGASEIEMRAKNALADMVGGAPVDLFMALKGAKTAKQAADAYADDVLDARPEMDIDAVSSRSIASHDPLPAPAQVAPEVSLKGTVADAKLTDEVDEASGEFIVRSENGEGLATVTDNSIRMNRVDVAEAARGKGEGLAILRRFAQRAAERGLPLFSDVSISPAQVRVWEKLKAEGFDVRRNEASINPETGNLVSADPRKHVFEAHPKAARKAGTTRLYRGESDAPDDQGKWYTTNPKAASVFGQRHADQAGRPLRMSHIDLTPEEAAQFKSGPDSYFLPPEIANRATNVVNPTTKVVNEATPQPAPIATQAGEPKPDYGTSPIDVTEARLREEIGLTDEMVAEVRGKLTRGEIQPEEVADLIGINGARIDWTGVADEKALAGMLNTVSRVIDDVVGGAARYKRVSVATVEKMAGKIGASADDAYDLFQTLKSKGGIEARVMSSEVTLNASATKMFRLGNLVHTGQNTPEQLLELAIHDRRHMLLQAIVRGSKSMIARALRMMQEATRVEESAFNLSKARAEREVRKAKEGLDKAKRNRAAKPKSTESGTKPAVEDTAVDFAQGMLDHAKAAGKTLSEDDVADALSEMGYTVRQVRRLAKTIAKATDATQVHKIARSVGFGKAMQGRLATLYINNILSGFPTFAVNITSGWLKMAESIVERYGSAAISIARGGDKYDLIAAHRAAIATKAMWGDAFKLAAAAWKEGLPQVDLFGRAEIAMRGGVGRSVGEHIITAPSRVILTIDEYFKAVFYQQELHARAVEIAAGKARLFKGKAADQVFEQEYRAVLENPTDDVRLDAIENARYQTFQNPLESDVANGLVRLTNGTPALKFIVPFIRTPSNIMKQAILERSPLALARSKVWKSIAEGGREGNTVAFRTALSTIAFGVIFDAALDGQIKGSRISSGSNKNSKDFDQQVPYTFFGVQYNRLDPWGTVIGLTADLATLYNEHRLTADDDTPISEELTQAFGNILGILSTNVLDKTYFSGIADITKAVTEAKSRPDIPIDYVQNLLTNMVPFSSLQRNFARAHDEFAREAFTLSDKLMAQTPFLRETLPVRRDYLGRPIREAERLGPDWLSPILIARDDPDPAAKAFAELEMPYQMPDKVIGGVQLSGEQYLKLVEVRGQFIRDQIMRSLNDGSWSRTPLYQRQDMVRAFAEAGGQKARAQLIRDSLSDPKGLAATMSAREAALNARKRAAE